MRLLVLCISGAFVAINCTHDVRNSVANASKLAAPYCSKPRLARPRKQGHLNGVARPRRAQATTTGTGNARPANFGSNEAHVPHIRTVPATATPQRPGSKHKATYTELAGHDQETRHQVPSTDANAIQERTPLQRSSITPIWTVTTAMIFPTSEVSWRQRAAAHHKAVNNRHGEPHCVDERLAAARTPRRITGAKAPPNERGQHRHKTGQLHTLGVLTPSDLLETPDSA